MNQTYHKTRKLLRAMPYVLFFFLATFYLYWFTSYIFFYQEKSSFFLVSLAYLFEHLNQPGGFLKYLGELQTTFYFHPFIGALLVSLELCIIIYLCGKTGKVLTGKWFYLIPFLVGAALFYLQTNYQYSAFNNLGILLQLALFYLTIRFFKEKYLWLPVIIFPAIYFLFGSFSSIFLGLISIYFLQQSIWLKLSSIWMFAILFFILGSNFLFFQTTETLIQYPFNKLNIGMQEVLFFSMFGFIILLPLIYSISVRSFSLFSEKNKTILQIIPFFVVFVLIIVSVLRIDKKNSHYFYVEKLFYEQKYEELVQYNAQFPSTNILTAYFNNLALAETGKLSETFFNFPQTPDGGTLFLKWDLFTEILKRGGYFYYSLGMINEAQRWAYEYMVMRGPNPETLKLMIKTDLIKGKYEIAEKYILMLEKTVFYRNDAKKFRYLLYNPLTIAAHPELGTKKKLEPQQDFFVLSDNPVANLDLILRSDSTNVFAIEYKLAWLMLQKDMKGIVDLLPVMEKAGYQKIPKNVEEAIVTYKLLKVGEMPQLERLKINPQTEQRFNQYYTIFQQNQGNRQQVQSALSREFSNTYWFYVFFN